MDALQRHAWPGNVRELENVVERAMIASQRRHAAARRAAGVRPARTAPAADAPTTSTPCSARTSRPCSSGAAGGSTATGNAAERLGIHPNTLRFRMKKLGVVCPDGRARRGGRVPDGIVDLSGASYRFWRGRPAGPWPGWPVGESSFNWIYPGAPTRRRARRADSLQRLDARHVRADTRSVRSISSGPPSPARRRAVPGPARR